MYPERSALGVEKIVFDVEFLKSRWLTFWWKYLPYNSDLSDRAKEMRKNLTLSERKIWKLYLQDFNKRWENKITILRQKIIDNYIVDFYIPKYNIIIEIDWEIHNDRKWYDSERTQILESYWLTEMRFSNYEIQNNFTKVCVKLDKLLKK
jgi:very-short-patch-repair endonuclease